MNKNVEKLKTNASFIEDCEKDLGRHTVIDILTENVDDVSNDLGQEISEILTLIASENERMIKYIMKVCFCSKSGAEHILDELMDDLGKNQPESYFVEKAGLSSFLEKAGFSLEEDPE